MEYTYKYPRPAVTADCVVITKEGQPKVLLIQRGFDPYKGCWAFPGGFMNMDETTEECAFRELSEDGGKWSYDTKAARCRKLKSTALFASTGADSWLNYRKAFLCPPNGNSYNGRDFERVNDVLFPGGTECLEVYRWTTDWSDYFDEGHEWWGALCLTVYDKTLERFVIITASATD